MLASAIVMIGARAGDAAPVQVHNKLVFTQGQSWQKQTVWTINSDGSDARQVWRVPHGYGHFGGFSSDGKQAISCNQFNLYVHDLSTGHFRRLLVWANGGWSPQIGSAAFSPDNRHIVCSVSSSSTGDVESWVLILDAQKSYSVVDSDDIARVQVRPASADSNRFRYFQDVSWSSDGEHLIAMGGTWHASHFDGTSLEVWTMNLDGSQGNQLTDNQLWEANPVWNTKTNKIAFTRLYPDPRSDYANDKGSDLFLCDADGTNERQLTHNARLPEDLNQVFRTISAPQFSFDGTKIAFDMMNSGDADPRSTQTQREAFYQNWIYVTDSNGLRQKRLVEGDLVQWIP